MTKILVISVVAMVLIGSLFVVFINSQKNQQSAKSTAPSVVNNNQIENGDPEQKNDLIASSEVNSVDQIEANNLADDIALDPSK